MKIKSKTSFNKMNTWKPDGFFISNGPGDPASMDYAVDTVKEILKNDNPPSDPITKGIGASSGVRTGKANVILDIFSFKKK